MESGTIASWKVKEGEPFAAGDSLAEIETDKATIDFEAQDDGVVAKILVEAGSAEIDVGVPIVVTVEEEGDVAAFKDFVVEGDSGSPSAGSSSEVTEEAAVAEACKCCVAHIRGSGALYLLCFYTLRQYVIFY